MAQSTFAIEIPAFADEQFMTAPEEVSVLKAWARLLWRWIDRRARRTGQRVQPVARGGL